jgi:hypothetical protein
LLAVAVEPLVLPILEEAQLAAAAVLAVIDVLLVYL